MKDVFFNLSQTAQHNPEDLKLDSPLLKSSLPDRWAATHPQQVQHERLAENGQVAEDKQYYRLQVGVTGTHPFASTPDLPSPELKKRQSPVSTATRASHLVHRARKSPEMRDA